MRGRPLIAKRSASDVAGARLAAREEQPLAGAAEVHDDVPAERAHAAAVEAAAAMLLINAAMMLTFVWVVRAIGPVFASQTANVIVLAGAFWGWLIFDEILSAWVWAAITVIAAGVALVTLRPAVPIRK